MAGKTYGRRLARMERQLRCPHHQSWLYCGCDDAVDIDRLSEAERALFLQLAEKAGALKSPFGYGVCARCGRERHCLDCNGAYLARTRGLARLTPDERTTVRDLIIKGLRRVPPA
jgi:hypothetical protein